jgi:hypothetical protein
MFFQTHRQRIEIYAVADLRVLAYPRITNVCVENR